MIAGSGATLGIWTPDLLKTLAQERQVIIFDNRGIGLSTDSAEIEHTADSYAESTVNLIDALGLDWPDVLGWSMGGFITLAIAVKYADRVHNIVLTSTSSGGLLGMLITEHLSHAQCACSCCTVLQKTCMRSILRLCFWSLSRTIIVALLHSLQH